MKSKYLEISILRPHSSILGCFDTCFDSLFLLRNVSGSSLTPHLVPPFRGWPWEITASVRSVSCRWTKQDDVTLSCEISSCVASSLFVSWVEIFESCHLTPVTLCICHCLDLPLQSSPPTNDTVLPVTLREKVQLTCVPNPLLNPRTRTSNTSWKMATMASSNPLPPQIAPP